MTFKYERVDAELIEEQKKSKPVQFTFGEHQIRAINYFLANPKAILAMSTGT